MPHLTLETIARLVEEEPTAAESAHLESCPACRAELDGMRDDVMALSTLPDVAPAPDSWHALEQRLADEGLIRSRRVLPFGGFGMQRLSLAAAAVVVFMAGTMAGRLTADAPQQIAQAPSAAAGDTAPAPVAAPTRAEQPPAPQQALAQASEPAAPATEPVEPAPAAAPQPRRGSPVTLASTGAAPVLPANMEEAASLLRQTEELYLAALTRYAELATQADAGDPVARLAALQSIVMTTQAALSQAPADPVINGYHLTALAQRDATWRQVAASTNDRWY